MTDWLSNTTDFKYDGAGNLSEIDYPNSTKSVYGYNTAEELDNITTTKSGTMQFEFDASGTGGLDGDGNLKNVTTSQASGVGLLPGNGSGSNAGTDGYTYDPLSRVTGDSETGPSGTTDSTSESYTGSGEATAEDSTAEDNTFAYGSSGSDTGCMSTASSTSTTFPYKDVTCDADGNRTCESNDNPCSSDPYATNFAYDAADRLTGVGIYTAAPTCDAPGIPSATECLAYDGNGDLVSTSYTAEGGSINHTLTWSTALGDPALAVDSVGSSQRNDFIDGPEGYPVEQVNYDGSTVTPDWYYGDLEDDTRVLLSSSGSVDQSYNYDDYGNQLAGTRTAGPTTQLLYQGDFEDEVLHFVFMQARWYDPQSGQFISRDPDVNETLQPYAYAGDDPISSADPTGLWSAHRAHLAYHHFRTKMIQWDKSPPKDRGAVPYASLQAAAMVGNLIYESRGTLSPLERQQNCPSKKFQICGIGIAQWTYRCGPYGGCKKSSFKGWYDLQRYSDPRPSKMCRKHQLNAGCPWFRYMNQVDFVWAEAAVKPWNYDAAAGTNAGSDLESTTTLCQATNYWEQEFEHPADPADSLAQRYSDARGVLNANHGGSASSQCSYMAAPNQ